MNDLVNRVRKLAKSIQPIDAPYESELGMLDAAIALREISNEISNEIERLQARVAELEKERDSIRQALENELATCRNATRMMLESSDKERDSLQSAVRTLREALEPMAKAGYELRKLVGEENISDWQMNYRGFIVDDFDVARAALDSTASLDIGPDWRAEAEKLAEALQKIRAMDIKTAGTNSEDHTEYYGAEGEIAASALSEYERAKGERLR